MSASACLRTFGARASLRAASRTMRSAAPSAYRARQFASATTIPKVQRALVCKTKGKNYTLDLVSDYPVPQPKEDEVLVKLTHSGICHSDLSLLTSHWNGLPMACDVAGHEGVGRIVAQGSKVDPSAFPEGLRVGVPLTKEVCHHCESCLYPDGEVYCDNVKFYAVTENGSFSEYVTVNSRYLVTVPEDLPGKYAAPLLCGGVTAYKGIKKAGLSSGEFLTILGAGGGLGSMATFYAKIAGLRIIAVDVGEQKRETCMKYGAEHYIDSGKYPDFAAEVYKYTKRGAHAAIVFPPNKDVYSKALQCLGKHGTLICVGLPHMEDTIDFRPNQAVFMNIKAIGSLIGSRKDLNDSLAIAAKFGIEFPSNEVPMEKTKEVLDDMAAGKLIGRAVIKY